MTSPHPDKTIYVPDNRPTAVPSFTRFAHIARGTPVWLEWENFLCEQFHRNFVHRVSEHVNRSNASDPNWRGTCFFNNDVTMLDYRNFKTDSARTGLELNYYPQGRRMGVDLRRLLADPEITCFVGETIQSPSEYNRCEENVLSHGMDMAREYGRAGDYGFMVHYCQRWGACGDIRTPGAAIMDDIQEDLRWEMICKYRPPIFSFYSIPAVLVPQGAWYRKEAADLFWKRVEDYKKSFGR
jgi:hypothetical protein